MAAGCLDEGTVVAFLEGSLVPPERSTVEDHLATCSSCSELVTLAAEQTGPIRAPVDRLFIGTLAPGSRVDRYQILGAVGRGGMGEVYAAYHPDLDRRIALKVVNESGAGTPERRARLLREARAVARLSHPNVIAVHDAGTFDDRVYIAMEFVAGETVDAWLRAKPRGWREILDVFIAAGRGLEAAHTAGVVHRDFKPQNVMIGRDGSVRVMDFGLARLAEEPADPPEADDAEPRPRPATITRTGAVVGTLAYMSPEQFRGAPIDARADQFSFCVALHEALYGRRPALAHVPGPPIAKNDADASQASRRSGAPAWLRGVIARGLAADRTDRFASMDALLAAVGRGQTRIRQRTVAIGAGVALALLSLGTWRLAAARRVSCEAPNDRLAAVWRPGDESNPRRQSVHRAFTSGGRPSAEAAWQRVAKTLDDYASQWSAMYVQTCEATHVRGEQSGEVLDLRMGCLAETLDGVRALTEVLSRGGPETTLSQAVTAAQDLPPLSRCADVPSLRSAVPLPRDRATAESIRTLRASLRDAVALEDVGNGRAAMDEIRKILPRAEATGYKPLIAEVLYLRGVVLTDGAPKEAEIDLEKALFMAEASRDDITAAKAASALVFATGGEGGRRLESDRWANLGYAILDRIATPQPRIRAWLLHDQGATAERVGDLESARRLLEQAFALKEAELGKNHPDVGRTAVSLASVMTALGLPDQALPYADLAVETFALDLDSFPLACAHNNRGDTLVALKRYAEAEHAYREALRILSTQLGATHYKVAYPMHGLGEASVGRGDPGGAVRHFDAALRLKQGGDPDAVSVAGTQFALAKALVAGGGDRKRAVSLAAAAQKAFASGDQPRKQREVVAWLAAQGRSGAP